MANLWDDVCEHDKYHIRSIKEVRESIDKSELVVSECNLDQADKITKVLVYNYFRHDLSLYPVTAEKKLSIDASKGRITEYGLDELTVPDMLRFIKAYVDGQNLSRRLMPQIYMYLQSTFGLDVYMSKVVAQLYYATAPLSEASIRYRSDNMALSNLIKKGIVHKDSAGHVELDSGFRNKMSLCVIQTIV